MNGLYTLYGSMMVLASRETTSVFKLPTKTHQVKSS